MQDISIRPIARMKSDFPTKFGIPRQAGLVEELRSTIIFEPEYRNPDALRGIEDFTHLWLIWQFSEGVRHPFPFPSQFSWLILCPVAGRRTNGNLRHRSSCRRR